MLTDAPKARIAVLVSGGGTNLQALIDAGSRATLKSGEIILVISSKRGAYALERAQCAGIPTVTVARRDYSSPEEFDRRILKTLREYGAELVVLAGFLSILGPEVIAAYRDRIINVHPALIPSFSGEGFYGLRVHRAALDYGVKITGATVHYVNEVTDGGRIILQKAVAVRPGDTPEILQDRVMRQAEWKILPKAAEIVSKKIVRERGN